MLLWSIFMGNLAQYASVMYAIGTVCCWGVSDFLGGYTSRRFNSFLLALLGHCGGFGLVLAISTGKHLPVPTAHAMFWAMLAGASGGTALGIFYRALSRGNMGLTAPVSTVIGAAIPAVFAIATEGLPRPLTVAGFALALAGVWLISRADESGPPQGLGLAFIAGFGFAGFYICMKLAGNGAAPWLAVSSRGTSLLVTAVIVLVGRQFQPVYRAGVAIGVLAGCLDVTGTMLFIRAAQTGRLDTAVVLTSLYPVITILLARAVLKERFTLAKTAGMAAAVAAVPMIARG